MFRKIKAKLVINELIFKKKKINLKKKFSEHISDEQN